VRDYLRLTIGTPAGSGGFDPGGAENAGLTGDLAGNLSFAGRHNFC